MPADWCWQLFVFQAITGAQTPACLFAASDPVETVTPPIGVKIPCDLVIISLLLDGLVHFPIPGPWQAGAERRIGSSLAAFLTGRFLTDRP